jgi:hypothetical protein
MVSHLRVRARAAGADGTEATAFLAAFGATLLPMIARRRK